MGIQRILYLHSSLAFRSLKINQLRTRLYPEVNFEVTASTKFAVADLEGDSHFVIGMQEFVKAFSRMRLELDIMSDGSSQQRRNGNEYSEDHFWFWVGRGLRFVIANATSMLS
jgi:hypothetical protein